jgi:Domain of Unknown Function with PDB structure (DUF3857)
MVPRIRAAALAGLVAALAAAPLVAATDWLPISPDDLKMSSEPMAPGAPAVYLYRQIDRDDAGYREKAYVRIKILATPGLQYANVAIPFNKEYESIRDIEARTIRPDGSIAQFDGQVFERPVLETKGIKVFEKTFTLPAAEVGCIVEYRYVHRLRFGYAYDSHWILSGDLFTRDAKFSLEPNRNLTLRWSWPRGLPGGSDPPKKERDRITLEVHNVPAFVKEDYMPPENELKYRVDFIYSQDFNPEKDPDKYWRRLGSAFYEVTVTRFIDQRSAMSSALKEIVLSADPPETKLRKIYARVEQIRNSPYETPGEREAAKEKPQDIRDVADVWKRGYGNSLQINWLFLALVRAAGMEADPAVVSTRDRYFFNPKTMNPGELDATLVVVTVGGRKYYLAPGVPFTPFGLLPWSETAVSALLLRREGGEWITTPLPAPTDSRIVRRGALRIEAGALEGKLTVTYTGLEASWRRMQMRGEDEAARRRFLEDQLKGVIPTGSDVKLTNSPDWSAAEPPLVAEFEISVPGWVTPAGRHSLLPIGLFGAAEKHVFEHAERTQPIYFDFPYLHYDALDIELPAGWSAQGLPKPRVDDLEKLLYTSMAEVNGQTVHVRRALTLNLMYVDKDSYDALREFFETVRTGDEDDVVLSSATVSQSR